MLNSEEQDLLWKFRFYLCSHKKALIKFLKCINWGTPDEVQQALSLLNKWAAMDVEDALELLGPTFRQREVRRYAIGRLMQASDEDLLLYLLQLVQALKYENFDDINGSYNLMFPTLSTTTHSPQDVGNVIDQTTTTNVTDVNREQRQFGLHTSNLFSSTVSVAKNMSHVSSLHGDGQSFGTSIALNVSNNANINMPDYVNEDMPGIGNYSNLSVFLIQRACRNATLANYLFWYLSIEVEEQASIRKQHENIHKMYALVRKMFLKVLKNGKMSAN